MPASCWTPCLSWALDIWDLERTEKLVTVCFVCIRWKVWFFWLCFRLPFPSSGNALSLILMHRLCQRTWINRIWFSRKRHWSVRVPEFCSFQSPLSSGWFVNELCKTEQSHPTVQVRWLEVTSWYWQTMYICLWAFMEQMIHLLGQLWDTICFYGKHFIWFLLPQTSNERQSS